MLIYSCYNYTPDLLVFWWNALMLQKNTTTICILSNMKVRGIYNWYKVINSRSWQLINFSLIYFFKHTKCCHIPKMFLSQYNIYSYFNKYKQKTKKQTILFIISIVHFVFDTLNKTYNFFKHRNVAISHRRFQASLMFTFSWININKRQTKKHTILFIIRI